MVPTALHQDASRSGVTAARFEALLRRPELGLLDWVRPWPWLRRAGRTSILGWLILGIVALLVIVWLMLLTLEGLPSPISLGLLVVWFLAAWGLVRLAARRPRFGEGKEPVLVIEQRSCEAPSDDVLLLTQSVLLEDASGRRTEYRTNAELARKLAPGDMGLAFSRGDELLFFLRLPV